MLNVARNPENERISALASLVDVQIAEAAREAAREAESPPATAGSLAPRRPFASHRALVISWTLCLGLTVVNLEFGGLFGSRAVDRNPFELVTGLKTSAALDAVLIEEYRSEHGSLPMSLSAVGLPDDDPTLEYQRTDGQFYRVIARHREFEGIFDSRLEAERRAAAADARAAEARRLAAELEARAADAELRMVEAETRTETLRRQAREEQERERTQ